MSDSRGRGRLLGVALGLVVFVASREGPFGWRDIAKAIEDADERQVCRRTGYRWIAALEWGGLIERAVSPSEAIAVGLKVESYRRSAIFDRMFASIQRRAA